MTRWDPLRIFIGYDSREPVAYHVLVHSLLQRAECPLVITPLVRSHLGGIYWRARGPTESTEFAMTRFLVPYLCDYQGHAVFMDCDMLCQVDIGLLWLEISRQPDKAVLCCQHDYVPRGIPGPYPDPVQDDLSHWPDGRFIAGRCTNTSHNHEVGYEVGEAIGTKFLGQPQTAYPRKNWSSFMVFNNARCTMLTPEYVNRASGLDLHRFHWLREKIDDELEDVNVARCIGRLPLSWNWLVGEYDPNPKAKILHYTRGGPWFEDFADCDHADIWCAERDAMLAAIPVIA